MTGKILISGTSGIGKSTLAQALADKHDIPFINGSSTILWPKYGIKCHKDLLLMGMADPFRGMDFQYELVDKRLELLRGHDAFVTDRSLVDNIVYFLYQNAPFLDDEHTIKYINYCRDAVADHDGSKLIFLTRQCYVHSKPFELEDDGKRIKNKYFQDMMDGIFKMVIREHNPYNTTETIKYYELNRRIGITETRMQQKK